MSRPHVYRINENIWVAADSLREAVAYAFEVEGADGEHDEIFSEELTPLQMRQQMLFNEDGEQETFRQHLDRMIAAEEPFPVIFCAIEDEHH